MLIVKKTPFLYFYMMIALKYEKVINLKFTFLIKQNNNKRNKSPNVLKVYILSKLKIDRNKQVKIVIT